MEHIYPMEDLLGLLQVLKLCPKMGKETCHTTQILRPLSLGIG